MRSGNNTIKYNMVKRYFFLQVTNFLAFLGNCYPVMVQNSVKRSESEMDGIASSISNADRVAMVYAPKSLNKPVNKGQNTTIDILLCIINKISIGTCEANCLSLRESFSFNPNQLST